MSTDNLATGPGPRIAHTLQRMRGRDPHEHGRASTPLELLYDLTVVVAISLSGSQLAEAVSAGHVWSGIGAFAFVMFAILWAWISYSWFASAFDTDDWYMRVATLVQMIGVLIIGLGVADIFAGLEHGEIRNRIVVAGYVVMRLSMVALWLRVAKESPQHRAAALAYVRVIVIAQVGWVALTILHPPTPILIPAFAVLYVVELGGAWFVEKRRAGGTGALSGTGTPWHPHHIAERYSLIVIITLGEVILGTTTAIGGITHEQGWSWQAVIVAFAGVSLAFGIWWIYFGLPMGEILARRPERGFRFGWGHLPLFAAIAAIGAGLHVAETWVEGTSTLTETQTVLALAIPLALAIAMVYLVVQLLMPMNDPFHILLLAVTIVPLAASIAMAAAGVPIGWCILVLMLAPWVSVVGYETLGHRHLAELLDED